MKVLNENKKELTVRVKDVPVGFAFEDTQEQLYVRLAQETHDLKMCPCLRVYDDSLVFWGKNCIVMPIGPLTLQTNIEQED